MAHVVTEKRYNLDLTATELDALWSLVKIQTDAPYGIEHTKFIQTLNEVRVKLGGMQQVINGRFSV